MSINILRGNIAEAKADAIVNSANPQVAVGRGVDHDIYSAAGYDRLFKEREKIGPLDYGQVACTDAFDLDAKYIFHTAAPFSGKEEILEDCYRGCLKLAQSLGCESVAFPLLGAGNNGIKADRSLRYAVDILKDTDIEVQLYVSERVAREFGNARGGAVFSAVPVMEDTEACISAVPVKRSLDIAINDVAESFQEMLLRMIDERGLKDSQVYKRANISRKLFSKIRSSRDYHPSKKTVLSFAVALKLSMKDTVKLLEAAGYAFSPASREDNAVKYFIEKGMYDIYEINISLFEHGLETLY